MTDQCGKNIEGCNFDVLTEHKVIDNRTNEVVDVKSHKSSVNMSYASAMAIQYVAVHRGAEAGAETFLKILGIGGDPEQGAIQVAKDEFKL